MRNFSPLPGSVSGCFSHGSALLAPRTNAAGIVSDPRGSLVITKAVSLRLHRMVSDIVRRYPFTFSLDTFLLSFSLLFLGVFLTLVPPLTPLDSAAASKQFWQAQ